MDTHARYTPKFFSSSPSTSSVPPRLLHFDYPYSSLLSFTFQDAYQRQNIPPDSLHGFRCTAYGNMKRFLPPSTGSFLGEYLQNSLTAGQGFVFYESLSHILGFGYHSPQNALVVRMMPRGIRGLLLSGILPIGGSDKLDLYGAVDWRGGSRRAASEWNADLFAGVRYMDSFRLEAFTRVHDMALPNLHFATLNAVLTAYHNKNAYSKTGPSLLPTRLDLGAELSFAEGSVSNLYLAMRLHHHPSTSFVFAFTVLGHLRFLFGYNFTNYLKFAAQTEVHLTSYRAATALAARFTPALLPRGGTAHALFSQQSLLKYLTAFTARVDMDKGMAFRADFSSGDGAADLNAEDNLDTIESFAHRHFSRPSSVDFSLTCEVPYPSHRRWMKDIAFGADISVEW